LASGACGRCSKDVCLVTLAGKSGPVSSVKTVGLISFKFVDMLQSCAKLQTNSVLLRIQETTKCRLRSRLLLPCNGARKMLFLVVGKWSRNWSRNWSRKFQQDTGIDCNLVQNTWCRHVYAQLFQSLNETTLAESFLVRTPWIHGT
jgi:hypothetical protein